MALILKKKIAFFEGVIADFFKKVGREHLPWRNPRKTSSRGEPRKTSSLGKGKITAYEVWVSEIMLQQTQVSRVIDYYVRFLKKYPTVQSLAKSDWEEFLPYYEGLGYYARGRNMLKAAKRVVEEYGGKFPKEKVLLEKMPGIGPYTASAILSFAYDENHLAWDTNLKRVIGRFFFGNKRAEYDMEEMASQFSLPAKTLNAGLMDFGSALCLARPKCEACPLRMRCVFYKEKGVNELRVNELQIKQKENWKETQAVVFLHENHQRYFSSKDKVYAPFVLPKGYDSRAGIKDWFQKKYGLAVSVRPPHGKLIRGKKRILLMNAQILSGHQDFAVFSKKEYRMYNERLGFSH